MSWVPCQPKPFHDEVVVAAVEFWELNNADILFFYDKNTP